MLIEPMIQQLHTLRLRGMAAALEQLLANAQHAALSFEERLSVMIQHEITDRDSKRLAQRLRWAKLPQNASLEDLDSINFALGLRDFDVAKHQPHPPGYPLFILAAKAVNLAVPSEAHALAVLAILAGASYDGSHDRASPG